MAQADEPMAQAAELQDPHREVDRAIEAVHFDESVAQTAELQGEMVRPFLSPQNKWQDDTDRNEYTCAVWFVNTQILETSPKVD
jgi:hypothetical protein